MHRTILFLAGSLALAACQGRQMGALPNVPASGTLARSNASVNWPQFRFNDGRTGVNPHETTLNAGNVPRLQLVWAAQLGSLVDYSSPAIVNGFAYIASTDGRLWAYPANGCGQTLCTQPTWASTSLGEMRSSPTVAGGFVYVGSQTSFSSNDGKLDTFSAAGCGQSVCAPLWQGIAGDDAILQASAAVSHGRVFIGGHDGKLYAFNALGCGGSTTCQPLWTAATGGPIESTPTIEDGTLYVGSDDGNLYAFKARGCGKPSCKPLWTGSLPSAAFEASPAIVGKRVYMSSQHGVAVFNTRGCGGKTCQPLWEDTNGNDFFNGSPAIYKGHVYIGDEDGLAVYSAKGCGQKLCSPQWIDFGVGFQAAIVSSPTAANGVVYAGRNTGEVLAWKAGPCGQSVCDNIWSGTTNEEIVSSSPSVVNGQVYIGSADDSFPSNIQGRLYVFAIKSSSKSPMRRN